MVEMVEILDGRLGKRSDERVRYVINNLLHLVIVKYGDISLELCISIRLRLVTILSLLVKYLVILHADPCNKSYIYYIPLPLTVHFSMTRSVKYQPILHTLYYTLHTEHAYCLSYRFLNNVVITTVIALKWLKWLKYSTEDLVSVQLSELGMVINNLLHLVIVKYGDISLVLCISTRLRLVTILSLLVKYLVILHADPCNWRASEASETLSGLFNRESYIIYIYIYYGTCKILLL